MDFRKNVRQVTYGYAYKKDSSCALSPDNNIGYGTWDTPEEGWAALLEIFGAKSETEDEDDVTSGRSNIPMGIKIGVEADGYVTEYWLQGGYKFVNLVQKGTGKQYKEGEYGIKPIDNTAATPEINVDFGDAQDALISELFDIDSGTEEEPSTGSAIYDTGNGGTAKYHGIVLFDTDTNGLTIHVTTNIGIGINVASYTSADQSGYLAIASYNGASVNPITGKSDNNVTNTIKFASAPASISVTPNSTYLTSEWHWTVDGNARSIVTLNIAS